MDIFYASAQMSSHLSYEQFDSRCRNDVYQRLKMLPVDMDPVTAFFDYHPTPRQISSVDSLIAAGTIQYEWRRAVYLFQELCTHPSHDRHYSEMSRILDEMGLMSLEMIYEAD